MEVTTTQYETRLIGPTLAELMLENNGRNRKLSGRLVAKLAKMMKEGQWVFDGAPIRLDTEGHLIDGQHRLWAVIESGTTQTFLVVMGLPTETMAVMDTGKSRNFADVLRMHDQSLADVSQIAATANIIYRWEVLNARGKAISSSGASYIPYQNLLDFFIANREELLAAFKVGRARAKGLRTSTSALALVAWLTHKVDEQDSEFFFDRLLDGAGLPASSPILTLRNFFLNTRDKTGTRPHVEMLVAFTVKAWNAFRDGDELHVLQWRRGGAKPESFPIPR